MPDNQSSERLGKILLITTSWPRANEGAAAAGTFVVDFAKSLIKAGNSVTVLTPDSTAGSEQVCGINVEFFKVPHLPLSTLSPTKPFDALKILYTLYSGRKSVLSLCKKQKKPDHIFALWVAPSGYWAKVASKKFNIPYSCWALGSDIWTLGKVPVVRHQLSKILETAQFHFADGKQLCVDVTSISGRNCDFLPSSRLLGSRDAQLSTKPPYKLAFLGRWHPNKGPDLLLDALCKLEESDWKKIKKIKICGGGPLEEEIISRSLKLEKQGFPIEVKGYLDRAEAKELLEWADYLVVPSRIESIPVIFSDAMQMQTPIITTPVGDLGSLVEEFKCGILATNASSEAIKVAIKTALETCPSGFREGTNNAAKIFTPHGAAQIFLRKLALSME